MTKSAAALLSAAFCLSAGLAAAPQASADALCTVVAEQLDGAKLDETRAEARGRARHLACGEATGLCDAKLTVIRLADGVFPGPWPGAYCQIEQVAEAPPPAGCNVAACTRAYRSFRASDCTFQPYSGPRRLCLK